MDADLTVAASPNSAPFRNPEKQGRGKRVSRDGLARPRHNRGTLTHAHRRRREKVFGPGRAEPLDRNAKARILAYARAWGARHRQPGQHKGPITRTFLEVLEALLWGFHNSRSGCCFPSYEAIATRAECNRDTVYEALKVFERAGVLTWQNRIARIRERCRDLFGHEARAGASSALPTRMCS